MRFRTTIILLAVFGILLAFVLFVERRSKIDEEEGQRFFSFVLEDVERIHYKKENQTIEFQKTEEGKWKITSPLEINADTFEVDRLVNDFSDVKIERIVEEEPEDLDKYGFTQKELLFYLKDRESPHRLLIGIENPLDNTFFAKKGDETRVVLLPGSLKNLLDKGLHDFRQKDIFTFEVNDTEKITLDAKRVQWEAFKKEEEWFLQKPVISLAKKNKISDILYSLSGLKAQQFVSEEKNSAEMIKFGFDNPDYIATLNFSGTEQPLVVLIKKYEDKVYATSSSLVKIVEIEDSILSDLENDPEELREHQVSTFYSWRVNKLFLKTEGAELMLTKDEDDKWFFDSPKKNEADEDKVQMFIRKIENLTAEEFIDPPFSLKDYGLDTPQKELRIWDKVDEEKTREITLLIGSENKETKKAVIKNARLGYLFRVDSSFLESFPKNEEEWGEEKEQN